MKRTEPQVGMSFREAIAFVREGGKVRRPHWHKHSYLYAEKATERELWVDHRPYYPSMEHRSVRAYVSCDGDRTEHDWLKYEEPANGKSAT
jgi:hypothetical protein